MKKINRVKLLSILIGIILLLILSSFGYYTNIQRYYEDSRKSDGYSGYALERTSNEFIVDGCGSGTMLDTLTSLCWQKNMSSGGTKKWANNTAYFQPIWDNTTYIYSYPSGKANYPAFEYCEDLSLGGNSDWRIPSREELITLLDEIGGSSATCTSLVGFGFSNCQNNDYWVDSEYQGILTNAWYLSFIDGTIQPNSKIAAIYVVCVRSNY